MADHPFWSVHTLSRYSTNDALPKVQDMVNRAVELGYPALGLTDHGNMSGAVQLYKGCTKAGIKPLPGIELYVTPDREAKAQANDHLTVVAYTETGYRNLVTLNNLAAANFHYKPRVDFADFAALAEDGKTQGLAIGTGCYFGSVQQALITRGPEAAAQIIKALQGWFPRVYVELHKHDVPKGYNPGPAEDDLINDLWYLAGELGAPVILAADSHYTHPEHQHLHDGLKSLVAFGEDPSEAVFPGGPYSMVDRSYFEGRVDPEILDEALRNLDELANKASVRIPELDTFTAKVPDVSETGDADRDLRSLVMDALKAAEASPKEYEQAEAELEVMRKGGFAGYILLVWWVCNFMREKGIWFHTRGSASGSVVCHRIGITQVPPLKWNLRFDRFLSEDRISLPDIDLDVEHERRDEVIAALEERFSVRQVGSHMQMGLVSEEDEAGESSGSLLVKYWSRVSKTEKARKIVPTGGDRKWSDVPREDQKMLKQLGGMKLISGPGTHAAGYIVAPDEAEVAQLPLTWMAGRSAMVTSYGKKDVEALGFVKLDLLGLKTITAIRIACEAIAPEDPYGFWESIPDNDRPTFQRIGRGDTEGVFQLEGKSFTFGCKELKPKNLEEVVAAQALFRTAAMQAGATKQYIARRAKKEPVPDQHTDIMIATKETFGTLLYQEQVMAVARAMKMPADELTALLDAVKASNEASEGARVYLESVKPRVTQLAQARGWDDKDVAWFIDALASYAEYSFNKSHAASYGRVSYRTAYLVTHHPLEYWHGLLVAFQGAKRGKLDVEAHYVRCARKYGIRIMPAHVNKSAATYTIDGIYIRKGLTAIKGVGRVAAAELALHAPYSSLQDLGERVTARKVGGAKGLALKKSPTECGGVVSALHDYGALDGLEAE